MTDREETPVATSTALALRDDRDVATWLRAHDERQGLFRARRYLQMVRRAQPRGPFAFTYYPQPRDDWKRLSRRDAYLLLSVHTGRVVGYVRQAQAMPLPDAAFENGGNYRLIPMARA